MSAATQRIYYEYSTSTTPGSSIVVDTTRNKLNDVISYLKSSLRDEDRQTIIVNALLRLSKDCAIANWDGYGATAVNQLVLNQVLKFIENLSPEIPPPTVCPESDGEIAVEWYGDHNSTISISIGEHGLLNYAAIFPDKHKANGTESLNGENKGVIEGHIKRVLS